MQPERRGRGGVAAALLGIVALTGCTPATPPDAATETPAIETVGVIAVVDGDTIDVATDDGTARVRLIGIDTPEIGRGGEARECYAEQARTFLDDLVYGRTVQLQNDPAQDDIDRYGRLLRYVLIDGQSAAELAIAAGTGHEYTYGTPYAAQTAHRAAQDAAQRDAAGIWAACESCCPGSTPQRSGTGERLAKATPMGKIWSRSASPPRKEPSRVETR